MKLIFAVKRSHRGKWAVQSLALLVCLVAQVSAASFSVGTYNLELYTDTGAFDQPPKSELAREIIRKSIKALNVDILALQEVGSLSALQNLRAALKNEGVEYSFQEFITGHDTNLHVAFLSRYPIVSRHPHTNENFLYQGRRFHVLRGFSEIEVELPSKMRVSLITAHLKSKRISIEADQQGMREEEAGVLREKIDDYFKRTPRGNLIVLGDLNDGIGSKTLRKVVGRGKTHLFDTRPFERNGDSLEATDSRYPPRRIVWTHYFGKEETYSRVDYIFTSLSLQDKYRSEESYIVTMPDWGIGSDHRPIRSAFEY
jgi:endonuclease/exonuclease/phosphatase family metal-dependent hydrolase